MGMLNRLVVVIMLFVVNMLFLVVLLMGYMRVVLRKMVVMFSFLYCVCVWLGC